MMEAAGAMGWDEMTFWFTTPVFFHYAWKGFQENQMHQYRAGWEQAQILAAYIYAPYSSGKTKPYDVLPLPWQKEPKIEWDVIDPERLKNFNLDAENTLKEQFGWQRQQ